MGISPSPSLLLLFMAAINYDLKSSTGGAGYAGYESNYSIKLASPAGAIDYEGGLNYYGGANALVFLGLAAIV